jgi:hypothetical protein
MMLRSYTRLGLSAKTITGPCAIAVPVQKFPAFTLLSRGTLRPFDHLRPRTFTSAAAPNSDKLSWDEYLRLRRQRRLTGVIASIPTSMLGIYGGLMYFGSGEIDPTQTILGFDPFMMNAAFVLGCGILGWLIGPTLGRGTWHLLHRRQAHLIKEVLLFY